MKKVLVIIFSLFLLSCQIKEDKFVKTPGKTYVNAEIGAACSWHSHKSLKTKCQNGVIDDCLLVEHKLFFNFDWYVPIDFFEDPEDIRRCAIEHKT